MGLLSKIKSALFPKSVPLPRQKNLSVPANQFEPIRKELHHSYHDAVPMDGLPILEKVIVSNLNEWDYYDGYMDGAQAYLDAESLPASQPVPPSTVTPLSTLALFHTLSRLIDEEDKISREEFIVLLCNWLNPQYPGVLLAAIAGDWDSVKSTTKGQMEILTQEYQG